jgi:hypothetical protein
MRIIDRDDPLRRAVEVYAIYWVNNPDLKMYGQRMHLAGPYDGYNALIVVPEEKAEVVDPTIDGFVLRKSGYGSDIIVHWAASRGDLLDKLVEADAEALAELRRRITEDDPAS